MCWKLLWKTSNRGDQDCGEGRCRGSVNSKLGGQGSSKLRKTPLSFLPFFYLLAYIEMSNSTHPSVPSTNIFFVIPVLIMSVFLKYSFLYIPQLGWLCCCSSHFPWVMDRCQTCSYAIWQFLTIVLLTSLPFCLRTFLSAGHGMLGSFYMLKDLTLPEIILKQWKLGMGI